MIIQRIHRSACSDSIALYWLFNCTWAEINQVYAYLINFQNWSWKIIISFTIYIFRASIHRLLHILRINIFYIFFFCLFAHAFRLFALLVCLCIKRDQSIDFYTTMIFIPLTLISIHRNLLILKFFSKLLSKIDFPSLSPPRLN